MKKEIVAAVAGIVVLVLTVWVLAERRSESLPPNIPVATTTESVSTEPQPTAQAVTEQKAPYHLYHAGKRVFASTELYTEQDARTECIRKIEQYTDNASSICYWHISFKGDGDTVLYRVASQGAELEVRNVTVEEDVVTTYSAQTIRFEVVNTGGLNNAASSNQFIYNVSLQTVNNDGSHTPFGETIRGSHNVPVPGAAADIEVDIPWSSMNSYAEGEFKTLRAYIFVNPDRAVDERRGEEGNTADTPTWERNPIIID
jgi:hypothetical protein